MLDNGHTKSLHDAATQMTVCKHFEKAWPKLLVSHSKHFRLTPPHPISPNILKGHDNRKKLVATAQRRERIYKRTAEPSVTFCGEEEQRNGRLIFCKVISKNRKKLLTTVQRCECVYKRAAERSDTFCGEEKQWSGWLIFYRVKNRNKRNSFRRERVELVLTSRWHIWGRYIVTQTIGVPIPPFNAVFLIVCQLTVKCLSLVNRMSA